MFIALSQFTIANEMTAEVKNAFVDRPHLVENASGFIRLEVISPLDNKDEIWLLTYWRDEESFKTWHHGHLYHLNVLGNSMLSNSSLFQSSEETAISW